MIGVPRVTVKGHVQERTTTGVCVQVHEAGGVKTPNFGDVWFPYRQSLPIKDTKFIVGSMVLFFIPTWLAKKRGLPSETTL